MDANNTGTSPILADTDHDGLSDGVETHTGKLVSATDTGTDPLNPNTDGDLVKDGKEVADGTDPHDPTDPPVDPDEYLVGHWTFEGDTELEDLAGNNVGKPFEVDTFAPVQRRLESSHETLHFTPVLDKTP